MIIMLIPKFETIKMVKATGLADRVIDIAQSQLGYIEKSSDFNLDDFTANAGRNNYTKYMRDLGFNQSVLTEEERQWCAYFVRWVFQNAGVPDSEYIRSGYVPNWRAHFTNKGKFHERGTYHPKPGDLVIIANLNKGWPNAHIGIIESVDAVAFNYISGNTGNYTDRVSSEHVYLDNNKITGYCEVDYVGDCHPEGFLDSVVSEAPGTIKVTGWTYDPDDPTQSIRAYICVGGDAGDPNAEFHAVLANVYRDDVDNALHIGGYHGFEATIDVKKYGNQIVHVYGYYKAR